MIYYDVFILIFKSFIILNLMLTVFLTVTEEAAIIVTLFCLCTSSVSSEYLKELCSQRVNVNLSL